MESETENSIKCSFFFLMPELKSIFGTSLFVLESGNMMLQFQPHHLTKKRKRWQYCLFRSRELISDVVNFLCTDHINPHITEHEYESRNYFTWICKPFTCQWIAWKKSFFYSCFPGGSVSKASSDCIWHFVYRLAVLRCFCLFHDT